MSKRWPLITGYAVVALAQGALLVGAYEIDALSRTRMMVMRYLFAKNIELEAFWFSPTGRTMQVAGLVTLSAALLALGALAWRRSNTRFPVVQALIGSGIAALTAVLLVAVPTSTAIAVYAVILALWVALALQLIVIAVCFLGRREEA